MPAPRHQLGIGDAKWRWITITDEFIAESIADGLAREFDCWGQCRRFYNWLQGETLRDSLFNAPAQPTGETRVS